MWFAIEKVGYYNVKLNPIHSFSYLQYLSFPEGCRGSSPMMTRNTSRFSAISDSKDEIMQGQKCDLPRGPWSDSGPLSLGCSQQDLPRKSLLGHSDHVVKSS